MRVRDEEEALRSPPGGGGGGKGEEEEDKEGMGPRRGFVCSEGRRGGCEEGRVTGGRCAVGSRGGGRERGVSVWGRSIREEG